MSYEKKKLAGVLGNTHLGNYSYPPTANIMEQEPHPDLYPMRMNPMHYAMSMQIPQPQHTLNPADQCLSTPQPQSNEMVDDGSCMVNVPQVVMDEHLQEPQEKFNMEETFPNETNQMPSANIELPIQAEVVMGGENEEQQQQQTEHNENEDISDPPKLIPKKHCFVCNTQLPEDMEVAVPFFKTETTKTNKKFSAVITKLVGRSITPRKAHSEVICRRCFNLLDRIDTLEVELRESKDDIVSMYKTTLEQYGGKVRRKRMVVSRKSPFLTQNKPKTRGRMKKPKIEKQEEPILSQGEFSGEGQSDQMELPKELGMSDDDDHHAQDNMMHHDDHEDDDDDDDEDDDDDDDSFVKEDGTEEDPEAKKRRKSRKFKGTHLTTYQRETVIKLKEGGLSLIKIADILGFSLSTTKRVWKQYEEDGTIEKRKRAKHHRVTSQHEDDAIRKLITEFPHLTAVAVKKQLHLTATMQTIANRIKEIKGVKTLKKSSKSGKSKKPKKKKPPPVEANHYVVQPNSSQSDMNFYRNPFPPPSHHLPPHTLHPTFYKDLKDPNGYKVPNEANFYRENKHMPYFNDSVNIPQMYQQFYHN